MSKTDTAVDIITWIVSISVSVLLLPITFFFAVWFALRELLFSVVDEDEPLTKPVLSLIVFGGVYFIVWYYVMDEVHFNCHRVVKWFHK